MCIRDSHETSREYQVAYSQLATSERSWQKLLLHEVLCVHAVWQSGRSHFSSPVALFQVTTHRGHWRDLLPALLPVVVARDTLTAPLSLRLSFASADRQHDRQR